MAGAEIGRRSSRRRVRSVTGPEGRLDNTRTVLHLSRDELREHRWELRDDLRSITTLKRVRGCGRTRVQPLITVRISDGVAGYVGLLTCGSVWACPVCSAKVMMRRGLELAAATDWWIGKGGKLLLATTTARHHAGHDLPPLLDAVVKAWGSVTSGKSWVRDRELLGLVGHVRDLEVVHGRNGWHPHNHSAMFVGDQVDELVAHRFEARMFDRWSASLERRGYGSLPVAQRVDLISKDTDPKVLGRYLAKSPDKAFTVGQSIGYEMTSTQSKSARTVGRTQWELARSAAAGNGRDAMLWKAFEKGTHGRRQLSWSRGLRDLVALGREESDEEIAGEVIGTEADSVLALTPVGWTAITARPGLALSLLLCLQQGGAAQFRRALDEYQIDYVEIGERAK